MINTPRIKTYIRRGLRQGKQIEAYDANWQRFGINLSEKLLNPKQLFPKMQPLCIEIGFGGGNSLLSVAEQMPHLNFIGVETHRPGIGNVLIGITEKKLQNLLVYEGDVFDLLHKNIPALSVHGIQIFFPDPWPKRRHHARRLIQNEFLNLMAQKLEKNGYIHIATDWDDYADKISKCFLQNVHFEGGIVAERSPFRPKRTKFENRALREGRTITEFAFKKL